MVTMIECMSYVLKTPIRGMLGACVLEESLCVSSLLFDSLFFGFHSRPFRVINFRIFAVVNGDALSLISSGNGFTFIDIFFIFFFLGGGFGLYVFLSHTGAIVFCSAILGFIQFGIT